MYFPNSQYHKQDVMSHTHMQMHAEHNNNTMKTSDKVLNKKMPLTLLKGLCVRGSWRLNRTATY